MVVAVRSNFFEDIRTQVVDWFSLAGITLPEPSNLERGLFAYFSVRRRLIASRPRDVKWSRELLRRALNEEQRAAIGVIEQQARDGVDLTPRLSKTILDPDFNDGLLDDWGIHHLHLSNNVLADGFVERDGPLLFVLVRSEAMYFLDLLGHGTASFANDDLVQIVHDNWPDVIAFFRAPGAVPGSLRPQLSQTDRRKARKRLTVGWQAADGTIYMPPGGGASTAGLSPRVVSAADHLRQQALSAEEWVRQNADRIRDRIAEQMGKILEELHVRLLLRQPLTVLETQSNAVIPLHSEKRQGVPIQF